MWECKNLFFWIMMYDCNNVNSKIEKRSIEELQKPK